MAEGTFAAVALTMPQANSLTHVALRFRNLIFIQAIQGHFPQKVAVEIRTKKKSVIRYFFVCQNSNRGSGSQGLQAIRVSPSGENSTYADI